MEIFLVLSALTPEDGTIDPRLGIVMGLSSQTVESNNNNNGQVLQAIMTSGHGNS